MVKKILAGVPALLAFAVLFSSPSPLYAAEMGVNLAGAEFGSTYPGTYGTDYTYPTASELDYYKSKGFTLIRLPFMWERVQRSLGGPLDPTEIGRIQSFLSAAGTRGMQVVLDAHNYGRYGLGTFSDVTWHGNIIGSSAVPVSTFADFWTKMASTFKGTPAVFGYDLSNEPHDMGAYSWQAAAQAAVNGIRSIDTTTTIIVEGDCWSGAWTWGSCNGNLTINDSSNKIIYEAHQYFDGNGSGSYANGYDTSSQSVGTARVMPFINWLQQHNYRGYLGEYGVPKSDSRWFPVLDDFLATLRQYNIPGTVWAGGPWWGNYILSVESSGGVDSPVMSTLAKYPSTSTATSSPPAPSHPTFGIGTRVKTTANLNVRSKPHTRSGKILCTQPNGATGTIVGGPTSAQGYTWWQVNFDTGCDGWSVQSYLSVVLAVAPPSPVAELESQLSSLLAQLTALKERLTAAAGAVR